MTAYKARPQNRSSETATYFSYNANLYLVKVFFKQKSTNFAVQKSETMSIYLDMRTNCAQTQTLEYTIGSSMFQSVENSMVKGGECVAKVTTLRKPEGYDIAFNITGTVTVECDRCLDDMEVSIDTTEKLEVRFADHNEDTGETVLVSKDTTQLDLWPFIYDFIALAIPIAHVHPEGQCNEEMIDTLGKYMVQASEEED